MNAVLRVFDAQKKSRVVWRNGPCQAVGIGGTCTNGNRSATICSATSRRVVSWNAELANLISFDCKGYACDSLQQWLSTSTTSMSDRCSGVVCAHRLSTNQCHCGSRRPVT